ncbi:MAG: geranylgeranylglycerol-phosphate geranylgeranyltransferase [Bacteroidia bacterium]|nr:geranylgeranylglycerol-phosphate geranylgeranyltransferase [Bacteroidia bacterium]
MQKIIALLQLTRTGNLIIMLATLAFSYYCLTDYLTPDDLLNTRFILLALCVTLTAAAGYIINDYHDVNIDLNNKPHKVVIGKSISRRWAMLLHFSFNGIALLIGFYLNAYIALLVVLCIVLLWLYSVYFKRKFLSGNILVAALSAFVIVILPLFNAQISSYLVWVYALFAFGITLIREIVKDAEDLRGDSKFNCKTLPIVMGIRKTKQALSALLLVYSFLLLAHTFIANSFIPFRHQYGQIIYSYYMLFFVLLPLIVLTYLVLKADVKADFTRLSSLLKVIMLLGLLSMLLIKV